MRTIEIEPLTNGAFASFGDVVDTDGVSWIAINQGFAERCNSLARIDVQSQGGTTNVSIFTARARPTPILIERMERHPLGSQLFMPLQDVPWLVLVCADPHDPRSYQAFHATGRQGVNYARGVWHHPLLVLTDDERFLVIDRSGPGENLEEIRLEAAETLQLTPRL